MLTFPLSNVSHPSRPFPRPTPAIKLQVLLLLADSTTPILTIFQSALLTWYGARGFVMEITRRRKLSLKRANTEMGVGLRWSARKGKRHRLAKFNLRTFR